MHEAAPAEGGRRAERAWPGVAAIVAGAAAVAGAVGIRGNFPLSDDWSYAWAARRLCEAGTLELLPWTGASVVLQAGYGALLCHLFGFSFELLRLSTVVVATSGVVASYLLYRHLGARGAGLALATALVGLDPLWVSLGFTFMTDVPFAAAAAWAGFGYARGLAERRTGLLLAGAVAASAALLVRQHGILVAAAAALAALAVADRPLGRRVRDACAAGALPVLAFAAYHVWLLAWHGTPGGYAHKLAEARAPSLAGVASAAFRGIETLGLLLAPLAAAIASRLVRRDRRLAAAAAAVLAVGAAALWLRHRALMPYLTNVLYDFGVGALSLRDTLFLDLPPPVAIGPILWLPATLIATGAAAVLIAAVAATGAGALRFTANRSAAPAAPAPPGARARDAFLVLAAVLLFLGTLAHTRYYFDRYLLPVLPFAVAAVLAGRPLPTVPVRAWVLLAALGWWAVAGTHDYLAWNRARFAGLAALVEAGVPPEAIDGGVEFNGWHLAPRLQRWPTDAEVRLGQPLDRPSWWWVIDDRWVVAFRPLPGRRIHAERPWTRWLVPGRGRVLVLERTSPAPAGGAPGG